MKEEIHYFFITFFGVLARSASVFLFFGIFSISLMISTDDRVSAFNNFDICSKQASFSYKRTKFRMKKTSFLEFTSAVFDPIQSFGTINLKFLI